MSRQNLFNNLPKIVVSVADKEQNKDIAELPVDILEIRVDQFQDKSVPYVYAEIKKRKNLGVPIILTIRNQQQEGGTPPYISDKDKLAIFEETIELVDIVDIELSTIIKTKMISIAKNHDKIIIISSHCLDKTPDMSILESILEQGIDTGANIIKIAAKANTREDVIRLLEFTITHRRENIITMSLGRHGAISRLAFPLVGSMFTYTYMDTPKAEGQLHIDKLFSDLKFYGLINEQNY